MDRILVFGMTEVAGGVESFLMNYYRNIDRTAIQFDFLCNTKDSVAYEDEILALGGKIYHITARSDNPIRYYRELNAFFKTDGKKYTTLWVNVNSLANIDYLKFAKKYGISKRIIHSHNSKNMDSKLRGILHKFNRNRIEVYATDYWACSRVAAKWFFRDALFERVKIINNAIDIDSMKFDKEKRDSIRTKLNIVDKFVIGNVGRLHFQKNQSFIIEVFFEVLKINPESALVLVGQGEDEEMLKRKAKELNIEQNIHFVGEQKDIQAWLSSFDLFLFPSLFEGLGIALIEAQVNGLPIIASKDLIPEEVRINPNFIFVELNQSTQYWSELVIKMQSLPRCLFSDVKNNFGDKGFDIQIEASKLEKLLCEAS